MTIGYRIFLALAALTLPLATTAAADSCDPFDLLGSVELSRVEQVEMVRGRGLFWLSLPVDQTAGVGLPVAWKDRNGLVRASAFEVSAAGPDCSAVIDAVQIRQGQRWKSLRLAGENIFASNYFGERLAAEELRIGFNMILLQRAYCDVTVNALIYDQLPPYMRPSYPHSEC